MDMVSEGFIGILKKFVEEGKVLVEIVNIVCCCILEVKYKLGLFDNFYKYCDLKCLVCDIFIKEYCVVVWKIVGESFVLLKNEGFLFIFVFVFFFFFIGIIVVIGFLVNICLNMLGIWSVVVVLDKSFFLVEGLIEWVGNQGKIFYVKGSNLIGDVVYEERVIMFGCLLNCDNCID